MTDIRPDLRRLVPRRSAAGLALAAWIAGWIAAGAFAPARAAAQSPALPPAPNVSAAELERLVAGLTVTPRVLIVGMHPDDEPSELIAWLSRGKHVETAYLSITRGESGQNATGGETGSTLGAIRVQEALNARRIDGAHQFYTRAYDFGPARNAGDVFKTWIRDSVVADVVTIVRAFRPHVVIAVFPDSVGDGEGQHAALATIVDHAFTSSADARRFPVRPFGAPWPVAKLYRPGPGVTIETARFDRVLGTTYAELGLQSRAQQRTQGLFEVPRLPPTELSLRRAASRAGVEQPDTALFDAVDTTFARLGAAASPADGAALAQIAALADSARRVLDLARPDTTVPYLARIVRLASDVRRRSRHCRHPSIDASQPPDTASAPCDAAALDLDAAIDLVLERANRALLSAAGVVVQTNADRELVAAGDTANVMVTVTNRGTHPFAVFSLDLHGAVTAPQPAPGHAVTLAPDSTLRLFARVAGLEVPRPWWITQRTAEQYGAVSASLDGLFRAKSSLPAATIAGVAVPEELRRTSDVRVLLDVAGATISTSLGPVIHRYADGQLGLQQRQLAGVPDVTFRFGRALEWIPIGRPVNRQLRVAVKSYTDRPMVLGIGKLAQAGIDVGAIPKEIHLEGGEQRDLVIPLRGKVAEERRRPFGIWGTTASEVTYQEGFQSIERDYLSPIRVFRSSGVWLQGIDVTVPPNLTVLYVPEGSDDVRSALTQIGVMARELSPEALLTTDLSRVTTIAIASRALDRNPDLVAQSGRLMEFVRAGGTLVVQRGADAGATSALLPYPMTFPRPAEKVVHADAPVTVLDPASRLLNWPNRIKPTDWNDWVTGRAQYLPTTVDPRYAKVLEIHDPDQPGNRNALLVARVGKGTIVYTALTLDEQIGGGVPGALRLMVNLLSAGIPR